MVSHPREPVAYWSTLPTRKCRTALILTQHPLNSSLDASANDPSGVDHRLEKIGLGKVVKRHATS